VRGKERKKERNKMGEMRRKKKKKKKKEKKRREGGRLTTSTKLETKPLSQCAQL